MKKYIITRAYDNGNVETHVAQKSEYAEFGITESTTYLCEELKCFDQYVDLVTNQEDFEEIYNGEDVTGHF